MYNYMGQHKKAGLWNVNQTINCALHSKNLTVGSKVTYYLAAKFDVILEAISFNLYTVGLVHVKGEQDGEGGRERGKEVGKEVR